MKPFATVLLAFGFLATCLVAQQPAAQQPNGAAIDPPWTPAQVLTPDDFMHVFSNKGPGNKPQAPTMIHVGFDNFYKSKHVPGSIYAGPGRTEAGLELLKKAVAEMPKDRLIVLYCGCCPWDHCPNMKPAYKVLHDLGYKQIKVVEIPNSFAKDWVEKGYPVEGATASSPQ
jgi:thiosulfate/3-mercaptopyruvate sulfurtransferase